jgi:hypothetical protein
LNRLHSLEYREDVVEGFENTPKAFIGPFSGSNFGKRVVRPLAHSRPSCARALGLGLCQLCQHSARMQA